MRTIAAAVLTSAALAPVAHAQTPDCVYNPTAPGCPEERPPVVIVDRPGQPIIVRIPETVLVTERIEVPLPVPGRTVVIRVPAEPRTRATRPSRPFKALRRREARRLVVRRLRQAYGPRRYRGACRIRRNGRLARCTIAFRVRGTRYQAKAKVRRTRNNFTSTRITIRVVDR